MPIDKITFIKATREKEYKSVMTNTQYEEFVKETIEIAEKVGIKIDMQDVCNIYPVPQNVIEYIDEEVDSDENDIIELSKYIDLTWVKSETLSLSNPYLKLLIKTSLSDEKISIKSRESLIDSSSRILDRCTNPNDWTDKSQNKQGIVIGKVQSGKTMSMIALIGMALHEGYNLVIILAGNYDSLREQTQDRINYSFNLSSNSLIDSVTQIDDYGKSSSSWDNNILKFDRYTKKRKNTILCIKKNTKIIEKLITDLNKYYKQQKENPDRYDEIKALIIDDEVDSVTPDNKPDKGSSPTHIAITRLRQQIRLNSYIGYTATPQACFASHPQSLVSYPKDFVWLLETETDSSGNSVSYLGLKEYFLKHSKHLITNLNDFDWPIYLKSIDNGKTGFITSPQNCEIIKIDRFSPKLDELINEEIKSYQKKRAIPPNFKEACIYFILGAAIKWQRHSIEKNLSINELDENQINELYPYHTMMWHIYYTKNEQNDITKIIENIFRQIRDEFESNRIIVFRKVLNKINERTYHLNNKHKQIQIEDIFEYLPHIFRILLKPHNAASFVITLNSDQAIEQLYWHEEFDFKEDKHIKKICVFNGGHKLARGVTLQNLAVTVFTRFSSQTIGDTAMQMNRWFGHKLKYIDLCQLYIHRQVENTFKQIADADIMFRKIIKNNIINNTSTNSIAYKLFANTLFRVTSPNKSFFLTATNNYDYSGETQALIEPIGNLNGDDAANSIKHNYSIFTRWKSELSNFSNEIIYNHLDRADLYYNVKYECILRLMSKLEIQENASFLSPSNLMSYIDLWKSEYDDNKLQYDVPLFNVAIMRSPKNRFRKYKRKLLSDKEKSSILEMKLSAKERIVFSSFIGGSKTEKYRGDKYIDKDALWHKKNKNEDYVRSKNENILIVFYEFDPNYIDTLDGLPIEFQNGEDGYLDSEIPLITYFVSFNTEGPKFKVLYNKHSINHE